MSAQNGTSTPRFRHGFGVCRSSRLQERMERRMSEPEIQHPITANVWGVILRFGHVASVGMNLDHARKTAKEVGGYVMRGTVTFEEQIPSNDIVHKIEQGLKEKRSPREIADWIVYHLDVYGQWYAKHPDEPAPGRAVPPQS